MEETVRGSRIRVIEPSLACNLKDQELSSSAFSFSDPPDIRNWHSSYVYELPVLDSLVASENSNKEDGSANHLSSLATPLDNQKDHLSTKVPDSLQSEVQFSELPDISIWHSSYKYESLELSWNLTTDDELKTAQQLHSDVSAIKGIDVLQPQSLSKIADSSESLSHFSELPHMNYWHSSYVYESPQLSILDEITQFCYEDKKLSQDELALKEQRSDNIVKNSACTTLSSKKDIDKLVKTEINSGKDQKDRVLADPDQKQLLETGQHMPVPSCLLFKQPIEGQDKENEGRDTNSSGFVSIKKKRANKEKPSRNSDRVLRKCSSREHNVLSMSRGNRKALAETTNVYGNSESDVVLGSTGKWKCPQRSKPSVGPPLKQLRLEKWVNLGRK